jgi:hypothetical protein
LAAALILTCRLMVVSAAFASLMLRGCPLP